MGKFQLNFFFEKLNNWKHYYEKSKYKLGLCIIIIIIIIIIDIIVIIIIIIIIENVIIRDCMVCLVQRRRYKQIH